MEKNGRIKTECSSNCLKSQPLGAYSNFEYNLLQFTFATELDPRISISLSDDVTDQITKKKMRKISYENQQFESQKGHLGKECSNDNSDRSNDLRLSYHNQNQSTTIAEDNYTKKGKEENIIIRTHTSCHNYIQCM